jgi:Nucleotidyl transferase AbiEii toxin, Type IV TA system
VLLSDAPLTFREFMTGEPLPLASVFEEVFKFLVRRPDAILFGAHAVNAYCEPERMTQDVDLLSMNAAALAEDVRAHLAATLHIAARVREVVPEHGYRVFQIRKPKNRHLVDVRQVDELPSNRLIGGVRVIEPADLAAMKTIAMTERRHRPKGSTDLTDLQRLLLTFPDLKTNDGEVFERLRALGGSEAVFTTWRDVVREHIEPDEDETDDED